MGFCLFNNVAVAARHALDRLGAERVLVLDWDVHHGNGTNDIFYETDEVLYVSIHQSPLYPGTGSLTENGSGAGEGYTVNLPVPPGAGHAEWLSLVRARGRADRPRLRAGSAARVGGVRRAPRRPARELHAHRGVLCRDGRPRCAGCRASLTRRSASCSRAAMTSARWPPRWPRRSRPRSPTNGPDAGRVDRGPLADRARDHYRRWWPALADVDFAQRWMAKEGRRASTAPLPPASKAPQRLALPPGSLVCNGRRKGDRRGAVGALREAMALRAVRPEAVKLPPAPAGLTRPDALGREWPLIDGAPALDALGRRP